MRTSIVIATHNQMDMTRRCVESVRRHTKEGTYELIVIDNASADGTVLWLRSQPDVRLVENRENEGFAKACNAGARLASGERILLLNNDTEATPRWLEQLERALDSSPDIGAVGPVTNQAGYGQAIDVTYRNSAEMERFAEVYNVSSEAGWDDRLRLIGFCMLVSRQAWEAVGPLDESFGIGNFEDDDWCLRARLAGYRLLLCRDTFVHHEGGASFRHQQELYRRLMRDNGAAFERKWGFHSAVATNIRTDVADALRSFAEGRETLKVLEIGCGCGGTLLELRNRHPAARLFGFEPNERAAALARTVAEHVWTVPDPSQWSDGGEGYDVVILHDVFPTALPDEALEAVGRLLRVGGALAATVPNRLHSAHVKAYLAPLNRLRTGTTLSEAETRRRLTHAGFTDVEIVKLAGEEDAAALEALGRLTSRERRDDFAALYFVARAIKGDDLWGEPLPFAPVPDAGPVPAPSIEPASMAGPGDDPAASVPASPSAAAFAFPSELPALQNDTPFTGERVVLSSAVLTSHPDVFAEHVYRYRLAMPYCLGRTVLDAACGTGFGSRMLKDAGAASVEGVDLDPESIRLAERDYAGPGVAFRQDDILRLPNEDGAFDVVVSFETIEHVPEGAVWLREAARVLRPGGRLIVSTPNRETTNPDRAFGEPVRNPYHFFEYSLGEFFGELAELYDIEAVHGQSFVGPQGHVAPEWADIAKALGGAPADIRGMPPSQARYFAPAPLGRMKNAKPAYVTAVCRKKS